MKSTHLFIGDEKGLRDAQFEHEAFESFRTLSSEKFIAYLRSNRERRGLTRSQLAEAIGMSEVMINKLERGERFPSFTTKKKLFAFFSD